MTSACPCPTCGSPLAEIRLTGDLTMRSCSRCERRVWQRGTTPVSLDAVLAVVAVSGGKQRVAA